MGILLFYVFPLLAGKAFGWSCVFWGVTTMINYVTDNHRMAEDSDGVYRKTYTSKFANKLTTVTLVIMLISWIPLASVLLLDW